MNEVIQLLPYDGDTKNYGVIYDTIKANHYFNYLLTEIPWKHDEVFLYGKHITTSRKVAWFWDTNYSYKYSWKTRVALAWTPELLEIKKYVEQISWEQFNSCLLNLYADGSQWMWWHHDDEKSLKKDGVIASVSFWAERRFDMRHKATKEKIMTNLWHGSLLVMSGKTQTYWQHQIPKTVKVTSPRINLTFRKMI